MKRRVFPILLAICLVLTATAPLASAAEAPATRATFAQFLVDGLGLDARYDPEKDVDFPDLPKEHPNYRAIATLVQMGKMIGYSDGSFRPNVTFTRAEVAQTMYILDRYSETPETTPSDISDGMWYTDAVLSMLARGVMKTYSDNTFRPYDDAYLSEIDLDALVRVDTNEALQLDLSQGSVTIKSSDLGVTCVTQGDTTLRTSSKNILIRQSGATTANTITVENGEFFVTLAGVRIEAGNRDIVISNGASLTLNLVGENTVKGNIVIEKASSLIIKGTGTLEVDGVEYDDVIINNGNLTIDSGTVMATAFRGDAAAIRGGTVTINDGTITTKGTYGIRSNTVIINGGNVIASGWSVCAIIANSITVSENANLTLDSDLWESIFDLELPVSAAAKEGSALGLTTAARSASGISAYQWQTCATNSSRDSDWTDVAGQTSATYAAPMTAEQDGHYFRCKITNVYGNVAYTDAAQGFVLAFRSQPQSADAGLDQVLALDATATCPNVSYRWQRSYDEGATWADVPGETFSTLLVSATRGENGALYRCVITAANGDELASDSARIGVDTGEQTYTVRYYQENADGSGYTVVSQDVLAGEVGQRVTAPAKTFPGFTENAAKGVTQGTVTVNGLILSRYFDRDTCQITFHMNGGSALPPLSAKYGAAVQAPNSPTRYGYTFEGWYADSALTQPYQFTVMPRGGAAVYAKWTPKGGNRGTEYRVEELVFRDMTTYEALSAIPAGDFLAEVTVTNLAAAETDTVLLVTYDKSGKMLTMSYLYANPEIGQTITLGAKIQNSDGKVGKVKAMVLPNLASPTPLANALERS